MKKMTSKERFMRALRHQEPDRVPVFLMAMSIGAKEADVSMEEYTTNGEAQARAQLNILRRYKVDLLGGGCGVAYRAEAFGTKTLYYEGNKEPPVIIEPAAKQAEDWGKLKLDMKKPGISAYIQAMKIIRNEVGGEVPIAAEVVQPITFATHVAHLIYVMKLIKKDPALLHKGLSRIVELYNEYINTLIDEIKPDIFVFHCNRASSELLTKDQFSEFGIPYDIKTLEYLTARKVPIWIVNNGGYPYLEMMVENYPVDVVNWWDRGTSPMKLRDMKEKYGHKVCLAGGLNQTAELFDGKPEDVEASAKDAIEQAGRGGGFILSAGYEISTICPPENLAAISPAV